MKIVKFSPQLISSLLSGEKTSTWKLFDDKNLSIHDELELRNSENWDIIGYGKIEKLIEKKIFEVNSEDQKWHDEIKLPEEIVADLQEYYWDSVRLDTIIKIIHFSFLKK